MCVYMYMCLTLPFWESIFLINYFKTVLDLQKNSENSTVPIYIPHLVSPIVNIFMTLNEPVLMLLSSYKVFIHISLVLSIGSSSIWHIPSLGFCFVMFYF